MRAFLLILIFATLPALAQTLPARGAPIDIYDGFEGIKLSPLWETTRVVSGAAFRCNPTLLARAMAPYASLCVPAMSSSPAPTATRTANVTNCWKRVGSLPERTLRMSTPGACICPRTFPSSRCAWLLRSGNRTVAGTHPAPTTAPCSPFATSAGFSQSSRPSDAAKKLFSTRRSAICAGIGSTCAFRRALLHRRGRLPLCMDGKQVVDYTGVTANAENGATGYPAPSHYYFKMGLYRDVMSQPMTIYIDEYRKKQLPLDATSAGRSN